MKDEILTARHSLPKLSDGELYALLCDAYGLPSDARAECIWVHREIFTMMLVARRPRGGGPLLEVARDPGRGGMLFGAIPIGLSETPSDDKECPFRIWVTRKEADGVSRLWLAGNPCTVCNSKNEKETK
jgi:hypothetical protein